MKIAVEGCMHGELDKVYATIKHLEDVENTKIDLLICCGDFQAVRNENDLRSLNVPDKYRQMNSFWKYYSGQAVAPVPTIFIGGNHEASNYLWELYYGGWAAPNIYFLGYSGVIKFGNIRIGGLSGIYKPNNYSLGHFERPPYNSNDIRSVYHVRAYDVAKLKEVKEPIDIFISHDWPLGITEYGNWQKLVKKKPYFEDEIKKRTLGSKPAAELLNHLKPNYWFSAHLHCKFPAIIKHTDDGPITKFLALDKCMRGRRFLQVIDIEAGPAPYEIQYDVEWLTITRKFNSIFPLTRRPFYFQPTQLDQRDYNDWVRNKLNARGSKPFDFVQTASPFDPSQQGTSLSHYGHCRNPQTESFLQLLELPYLLDTEPLQNSGLHYSIDTSSQLPPDEQDMGTDDVDEIEEHAEVAATVDDDNDDDGNDDE